MYKEREESISLSIHYVPMLEELFNLIDSGSLEVESDEIVTYYFDEEDKGKEITCVSSLAQLMYLYKQSMA